MLRIVVPTEAKGRDRVSTIGTIGRISQRRGPSAKRGVCGVLPLGLEALAKGLGVGRAAASGTGVLAAGLAIFGDAVVVAREGEAGLPARGVGIALDWRHGDGLARRKTAALDRG